MVGLRSPAAVVAAVPVAAPEAVAAVAAVATRVECLHAPPHFRAVGPWYRDFTQVSDAQVRELLRAGVSGAL